MVRNLPLEVWWRACVWVCWWWSGAEGAVELIQCNMSDTTPSSAPASLGGLGVGVLMRVQIEQTGSWGPFLLSVFQRGVGWGVGGIWKLH